VCEGFAGTSLAFGLRRSDSAKRRPCGRLEGPCSEEELEDGAADHDAVEGVPLEIAFCDYGCRD
jgi:hypothetical protein